ncbi:hypothetical protein F7725_021564 [Dissostichus mawsoni]|uniref:Uncharacterized protein n=1 Tax=Dissostichus mawsoni TaxID=36200 RepID=A0A7J5ZBJ9_DISMA|nr:hypothetical protein F7725_021564 [Dissostichus mawsoni]
MEEDCGKRKKPEFDGNHFPIILFCQFNPDPRVLLEERMVPVDDGRGSGVQEVKAFEDLSAPRTQDLDFHHLETLQHLSTQQCLSFLRLPLEDSQTLCSRILSVSNHSWLLTHDRVTEGVRQSVSTNCGGTKKKKKKGFYVPLRSWPPSPQSWMQDGALHTSRELISFRVSQPMSRGLGKQEDDTPAEEAVLGYFGVSIHGVAPPLDLRVDTELFHHNRLKLPQIVEDKSVEVAGPSGEARQKARKVRTAWREAVCAASRSRQTDTSHREEKPSSLGGVAAALAVKPEVATATCHGNGYRI